MEADGPANTKIRNARRAPLLQYLVQAMRGDSFSACRVNPGPNINSTSFGMKVEPPALPCRNDIVVESGDAAPKLCLPFLHICSPTAADGIVPTGKTSTTTEITFIQPPLRFYTTEETNPKEKNYGLQFHPPGTTAASGD